MGWLIKHHTKHIDAQINSWRLSSNVAICQPLSLENNSADPLLVTHRTKQSSVFTPMLYGLFQDTVLKKLASDHKSSVYIFNKS